MKIVSFSVFGDDPKYVVGALDNAVLMRHIYPGWKMRVYTDGMSEEIARRLILEGAEIVVMPPRRHHYDGLFWRFLAVTSPGIERAIVRDSDSRINERERAAVAEWVRAGTKLHVMYDHPHHTQLIMGGMWGLRGGLLSLERLQEFTSEYTKATTYNHDQQMLGERVYPLFKDSMTVHRPGNWPEHPRILPLIHVGEQISVPSSFVAWHLGLGDSLVCDQLIRTLAHTRTLRLAVMPRNAASVRAQFRDVPNIFLQEVEDDKEMARVADKLEAKGESVYRLGYFLKGTPRLVNEMFDVWFYRQANMPMEWALEFNVPRNRKREIAFADSVFPGWREKQYAWVHEDRERGYVLKPELLPDLPRFSPDRKLTNNIFDYCTLIEHAAEIHGFDSCFLILADRLDTDRRRRCLHFYTKTTGLPQYRQRWEIFE